MGGFTGVLTLIHILFAAAWVGGAILLAAYGFTMMRADVPTRIAYTRMSIFAGRAFSVFAAVALIAGVWLVLRLDYYGFDQAWISIGFLAIIVGAVLGPAFFAPQARKLIAELEAGDPAAAARERRLGMVGSLETLLLLVTVWAMVYRPGA